MQDQPLPAAGASKKDRERNSPATQVLKLRYDHELTKKLTKQQQAEFQKFTDLKSEYCKKVLKRAPVLNQQEKIASHVCGKTGLLNLWQETMDAGTQAHRRDTIMKTMKVMKVMKTMKATKAMKKMKK